MGEINAPEEVMMEPAVADDDESEDGSRRHISFANDKENLPEKNLNTSVLKSGKGFRFELPKEYYTFPSNDKLEKMGAIDLASVKNFTVGHRDHGKVEFIDPVDLRGLVLSEDVIHFDEAVLEVYPSESQKPDVGQGLNVRARVQLLNCWPRNPDTRKTEPTDDRQQLKRFESKLRKLAEASNIQFENYDPRRGKWNFIAPHF